MPNWKKVITSGSNASLSGLSVFGTITNRSSVSGTKLTGSFTGSFKGSFVGDGSGLTGIPGGTSGPQKTGSFGDFTAHKIYITSGSYTYNKYNGEVIEGATFAGYASGSLVSLDSGGRWRVPNATTGLTSTGLLGITLQSTVSAGDPSKILLRGTTTLYRFNGATNPFSTGEKIYLSGSSGLLHDKAPATSGSVVRIVGYCLDSTITPPLIYFTPDNTWVTI